MRDGKKYRKKNGRRKGYGRRCLLMSSIAFSGVMILFETYTSIVYMYAKSSIACPAKKWLHEPVRYEEKYNTFFIKLKFLL